VYTVLWLERKNKIIIGGLPMTCFCVYQELVFLFLAPISQSLLFLLHHLPEPPNPPNPPPPFSHYQHTDGRCSERRSKGRGWKRRHHSSFRTESGGCWEVKKRRKKGIEILANIYSMVLQNVMRQKSLDIVSEINCIRKICVFKSFKSRK
jgi:hypothetical protein